jgi:hypothetical protein
VGVGGVGVLPFTIGSVFAKVLSRDLKSKCFFLFGCHHFPASFWNKNAPW